MSRRADRLTAVLPDPYAAREEGSLLARLLMAAGASLQDGDAALSRLLRSHWIDYAEGGGLDGLAGIFGVERRRLRGGKLEDDQAFRRRLKSIVRLYTGGGTVQAIKGAVQAAIGLPYDLGELQLPEALLDELDRLVTVVDYSPAPERRRFEGARFAGDATELIAEIEIEAIAEAAPRIELSFTEGGARMVSVQRDEANVGVLAAPDLLFPQGSHLVLTEERGTLRAVLDGADVSDRFTRLDGTSPPRLPTMPRRPSRWAFHARGGLLDVGAFDVGDTFDLPRFTVEMTWRRLQPLTFDVIVPYYVQTAVAEAAARHRYEGELIAFEGVPNEAIQDVVDNVSAAGVRGHVHFLLTFAEDQAPGERLRVSAGQRATEDAAMTEGLTAGSFDVNRESQDAREVFALGGVFDESAFDGSFGFE